MKKITIKVQDGVHFKEIDGTYFDDGCNRITLEASNGEVIEVSDGYHTMDELYEHRIQLFITVCKANNSIYEMHKIAGVKDADGICESIRPWRSEFHSDGTSYPGWFILGIGTKKGDQITYHLPIARWKDTDFVGTALPKAPEWDGHTSTDVLQRLKEL